MKVSSRQRTASGQRAASPVIGVVLLVAAAVLLAAVVAAFVLEEGDPGDAVAAGVTVDDRGDEVVIQHVDPGDSEHVDLSSDVEDSYDTTLRDAW